MYSKLTFTQKLIIWVIVVLIFEIAATTAIIINIAKNGPPKDIERFLDREIYYANNKKSQTDWHKESQKCTAEIENHPKRAYWYSKRAYAKWALKDYSGALKDLDEAIELDPNDPETLGNRAALSLGNRSNRQALNDVNKALELKPNEGWLLSVRAEIYGAMMETNAALADYDQALKLSADKRRIHQDKADLYIRIRRFDKAISELESGIKERNYKSDDKSNRLLVNLLVSVGQLEKAQEVCEKWIEEPSVTSEGFFSGENISKALSNNIKERYFCQKHLEYIQDELRHQTFNKKLVEEKAALYERLGLQSDARAVYEELLGSYEKSDAKAALTYHDIIKIAHYYYLVGNHAASKSLLQTEVTAISSILKKLPKNGHLLLARAELYSALQQNIEAERDFKAAKSFSHSSEVTDAWSAFALKNGNPKLALRLRQEFVSSHNPKSYAGLAEAFEVLGYHTDAIDMANTAILLDRFMPEPYYWLGKARAGQGDQAEAHRRFQQATALGYGSDDYIANKN